MDIENTKAYQLFGKRCRDLTEQELREYKTISKKHTRATKGMEYDRAYGRAYYAEHKEQCKERSKQWIDRNRTAYNEFVRQRRYKRRGYGAFEHSKVFLMFGKTCKMLTPTEKSQYVKALRS